MALVSNPTPFLLSYINLPSFIFAYGKEERGFDNEEASRSPSKVGRNRESGSREEEEPSTQAASYKGKQTDEDDTETFRRWT